MYLHVLPVLYTPPSVPYWVSLNSLATCIIKTYNRMSMILCATNYMYCIQYIHVYICTCTSIHTVYIYMYMYINKVTIQYCNYSVVSYSNYSKIHSRSP